MKSPGRLHRWWFDFRQAMCERGWHWPIRWDERAYPGSWDPPLPPEEGFACQWCGHAREPYRAWWWDVKRRYWWEWAERRPSLRDLLICILAGAWIACCFLAIVWMAGWAAGG